MVFYSADTIVPNSQQKYKTFDYVHISSLNFALNNDILLKTVRKSNQLQSRTEYRRLLCLG